MIEKQGYYSIGMIERDTGIGRDTLRIWERRYGFPTPSRNDKGERIYTESQLRRLQRIRRLLDQGLRPGKLIPLDEPLLDQLEAERLVGAAPKLDANLKTMVAHIRSGDAGRLDQLLCRQYHKQGMQTFVLQTVAPLVQYVGDLWASGELQVYQEHFLSQQLIRFLNQAMAELPVDDSRSRMLLATLSGEQHTLGLLMVASLLASRGRVAINLGGEVPMDQLVQAVKQYQVETVGLTFSAAYQYTHIRAHLLELRDLLPAEIEIWAGGEGVRRLRKLPDGIRKFTSLNMLLA